MTIDCAELSPRSADALLTAVEWAVRTGDSAGLELRLDSLEFVGPYGLVLLCLIGTYARQILPRVQIRAPRARGLCEYLSRVRLPEALSREVRSGPFPGTQIGITLGERQPSEGSGTRVR